MRRENDQNVDYRARFLRRVARSKVKTRRVREEEVVACGRREAEDGRRASPESVVEAGISG